MAKGYFKTEKGIAELHSSKASIAPYLASLLFMVNERKTVDELQTLFLQRGAPDYALDVLELGGFISTRELSLAPSVRRPVTRLHTKALAQPLRPSENPPVETGTSPSEKHARAYQTLYLHLQEASKQHLGMVKNLQMQMAIERASDMARLRELIKPLEDAIARKQGLDQGKAFRTSTEMLVRKISSNLSGLRDASIKLHASVRKQHAPFIGNFKRSHA